MSNILATGPVICILNGCSSTLRQAFDSMPMGVWGLGEDAWPPEEETRNSRFIMPFSAMPIRPHGRVTPGKTFSTTAPPSSSTKAGVIPFCSNQLITTISARVEMKPIDPGIPSANPELYDRTY
ncbi:MAG TPA: hypothetical protein VIL05_10625 [Thermoclostridium sp.]